MKRFWILSVAVLAVTAIVLVDSAWAWERTPMGAIAHRQAQCYPWHGGYYNASWGMPLALVVPPTAEFQTHWGWGVGNTRITTIRHQFERNYPGPGYYSRKGFRHTPNWPSDTDQFGVYYVRGPW
jgi:hypothetical protein